MDSTAAAAAIDGSTDAPAGAAGGTGRSLAGLLRSLVAVGLLPVCDVLAICAILLAQTDPRAAAVLAIVPVVLVLSVPPTRSRMLRGLGPTGRAVLPRSALVVVLVVLRPPTPVWVAAGLVCVALHLEPIAARLARAAVPVAVHLPGFRTRSSEPFPVGRLFVVDTLAAVLVGVLGATGSSPVVALVAAVADALLAVAFCADAGIRIRARRAADPALAAALEVHAPRFALHWDATPGTEYQVDMWLPHLARIGTPFVVVVRNPATFEAVTALTDAPVVLRRDPGDLDAVAVSSLAAVFYVNNAARNTHFVRFAGLEHVQLGHGDSDKAPSFSPVFRLYTRAFVPGPAAIERFARNGVDLPRSLFTVVGRPQVAGLLVGASTSDGPTALYAPTWAGANADSDHCSLRIGPLIVQALLDHGYRVLFRPHPYTSRSPALVEHAGRIDLLLHDDARRTGRAHEDSITTAARSLHGCFDAADLLVSDVSSVASDFLQTEKPYLLTAMRGDAAADDQQSSIAAGAYPVAADGAGLHAGIRAARGTDPRSAVRLALKAHVLGDPGDAQPADLFLGHARRVVLGGRAPGGRAPAVPTAGSPIGEPARSVRLRR